MHFSAENSPRSLSFMTNKQKSYNNRVCKNLRRQFMRSRRFGVGAVRRLIWFVGRLAGCWYGHFTWHWRLSDYHVVICNRILCSSGRVCDARPRCFSLQYSSSVFGRATHSSVAIRMSVRLSARLSVRHTRKLRLNGSR